MKRTLHPPICALFACALSSSATPQLQILVNTPTEVDVVFTWAPFDTGRAGFGFLSDFAINFAPIYDTGGAWAYMFPGDFPALSAAGVGPGAMYFVRLGPDGSVSSVYSPPPVGLLVATVGSYSVEYEYNTSMGPVPVPPPVSSQLGDGGYTLWLLAGALGLFWGISDLNRRVRTKEAVRVVGGPLPALALATRPR